MRKLLLLVVSLLFSLLLAEVVARVVIGMPQHVSYLEAGAATEGSTPLHVKSFVARNSGLFVTTPTGRRLRPNMHVVIEHHALGGRTIDIRTNSLGYRNPEIGPKGDRRRVLFLGDSVTWGDYLHEDETFVRRVQKLSESSDTPLETINAGVGAISMAEELAILKETGVSVHPDVVVLDFYLNDAQPSRMQRPPYVPSWMSVSCLATNLWLRLGLGRRTDDRPTAQFDDGLLAKIRADLAADYPPGPGDPHTDPAAFHAAIAQAATDWGSAWSRTAQARMADTLHEFAKLAHEHGFELRIVAFPVRPQVEADIVEDQPQQWVAGVAKEIGAPMLDLLPALRKAWRSGDGEIFYDHCHPNPHGSEVIAAEIWRFLQSP